MILYIHRTAFGTFAFRLQPFAASAASVRRERMLPVIDGGVYVKCHKQRVSDVIQGGYAEYDIGYGANSAQAAQIKYGIAERQLFSYFIDYCHGNDGH